MMIENEKEQESMITNEEAKCIADGMAEQMLNAIEKKVKKQMGDLYDETPENIPGLGNIHIDIEIVND